jgi:hypothetical protein
MSLQRPNIIKDMQHLPTNALKHLFEKKRNNYRHQFEQSHWLPIFFLHT